MEQAVALDLDPDDPPPAPVEVLAERFATRRDEPSRVWVATTGGEPVGTAWMARELRPGTFQLAHVDVRVVPSRRAGGRGRQLTELVLRAAIDAGATSVIGYPHDEAGIALCRRVGMTPRQHERLSVLRIADLDGASSRRGATGRPPRRLATPCTGSRERAPRSSSRR